MALLNYAGKFDATFSADGSGLHPQGKPTSRRSQSMRRMRRPMPSSFRTRPRRTEAASARTRLPTAGLSRSSSPAERVPRPGGWPTLGRWWPSREPRVWRGARGTERDGRDSCLGMAAVHYTNLLIVAAIGLLAPLALGFFPRLRLPAVVLELVLGIVIGPSGLGWAKARRACRLDPRSDRTGVRPVPLRPRDRRRAPPRTDPEADRVRIRAVVRDRDHPRPGPKAGGFVNSPLFVAIVLAASSVSVIFPVMKDANVTSSSFGQLVLASASIAEFGAIILLSLFFSGSGSSSTAGTLILVGVFGLAVTLVGVAIAGVERSISLARVVRRLQDTTAQIRVRAAFVLLIGFAALADQFGLETILGAFAAGVLLSLIDRDETTPPQFRLKLEAAGFGVFIPVFFVTSGLRFNLNALFASASTVARVPLFLLAIYLARGLPAIVYLRLLGRTRSVIAGVLQATSLTVIVAATQIGLQLGVVSQASAAGLVAAGLLRS